MTKDKSLKKKEDEPLLYPQKSKSQAFKEAMWNPDTKQFFGRDGKNWCLLLIFYAIYYFLLAGFFYGSLEVFLMTMIIPEKPYLTGQQSLIRATPGLSHLTHVRNESALLYLKSKPPYNNDTKTYLRIMKELVKTYPKSPKNISGNIWDCSKSSPILEKKFNVSRDVCAFPLDMLKECQNYEKQLNDTKPCLIFKMNKVFGWLPSFPNNSTSPYALIKCKGINPADAENLRELKYYPEYKDPKTGEKYGMIKDDYFPYLQQKNYFSPLVAVQLINVERHVLILMTCQLSGMDGEVANLKMEFMFD